VIVLAIAAAVCLVAAVVGLLAIELAHPSTDTGPGIALLWQVVSALIGVTVGVIVGRASKGD